jgi:hypothetical protein
VHRHRLSRLDFREGIGVEILGLEVRPILLYLPDVGPRLTSLFSKMPTSTIRNRQSIISPGAGLVTTTVVGISGPIASNCANALGASSSPSPKKTATNEVRNIAAVILVFMAARIRYRVTLIRT